ncbi:MAG: EAL domain-containing protein [Tatlockia sp.]|nr:EAL domain-containing protein [Tatlockia sp.]
MSALFARQAIFDTKGSVCAYELLYRAGNLFRAVIDESDADAGDKATSFILSHLFRELDINSIIGSHPAYINFTRNHILQKIPELLPKQRIVVELLENTFVDEALLENLKLFKQQGYRLALDDFIFQEEFIPLIELADVIKIEVIGLDKQKIKNLLAPLQGSKVLLLAEKIENRNQLMLCKELGFDLFQGFFLNHPDLIQENALTEKKANLLNLVSEIYDPGLQIENFENLILKIPKLSEQILRLANSPLLNKDKKYYTLREIIHHYRLEELRNWIVLLVLSSLNEEANDLFERTLIRAKMCQILASISKLTNPFQAYTAGLLSTLDAILNQSMSLLLSKTQLNKELNEALELRKGPSGHLLAMTEAYEQANFSLLDYIKFTSEDYSEAYFEAITYASSLMDLIYLRNK